MAWQWRYEGDQGRGSESDSLPQADEFNNQADAESWIGEHWRELLDGGVDGVTLLEDDTVVYGPLSLHDAAAV